jgi:hypothetical protein
MSDTKIKTSNIGNLAVTHDKLHTTMDLTAKNVTLPSAIADTISNKLPLAGGTMTGNLDLGTNKILFSNIYATVGDLPSASSYHGMFAHVHATGKGYYAHAGAWVQLANASEIYVHPDHSGEVTSTADGATVIVDDIVDEANLKVSNTPTNGYFLSAQSGNAGGMTWAEVAQPSASDTLTTIKTVDGTGSGLDADLLDGQQGSYYTGYADTAVANIVDSAPGTLDTLNELAAALGDDANYATTTATAIGTKLAKAGGQMTGNITMAGSQTVDGRDLSVDGTKLDSIETSATADQTAAQLLTAIKTVDGSGSGLDADLLDGNQASAFATAAQGTLATNALPKAGGTLTGDVVFNGGTNVKRGTHRSGHLVGGYNNIGDNSGKTNPIYSIGTNYLPTDTALSNHYGIGYTRGDASFMGVASGSGWGMYVSGDGDARIFLDGSNGNMYLTGTVDGRDVAADGTKLDGIASGANNFSMPSALVPATIKFNNGGPTLSEERDQNMKIKGHSGTDVGISGYDAANNWRFQLYGSANNYGFLNANWAGWDIMKTTSSHLYLNGNTTYYLNPANTSNLNSISAQGLTVAGGTTFNGNVQLSAGDTLIVGGTLADNSYNSNSTSTIFIGGGNDRLNYSIGTLMQNYGGNYTKLDLRWHTGIRMFAMPQYGGLRYYTDTAMNTQIFGVGVGDSHVRATNNIYAYTSDIRLKENFRPIENAVDKVKAIGGFIFDWRKDMMAKHQFEPDQQQDDAGLIAQEVQKVMPAAIKRAPFDHDITKTNQSKSGEEFLTVQYEKMVPLLVEAIKEQQKQIDELKEKLENLETK